MKNYVDQKLKHMEERSTAFSFTIVGIIGLIVVLLLDLNLLPLKVFGTQKVFMSIIMYLLFLIFLLVGIKSFVNLKKISKDMEIQEEFESDILGSFVDTYRDKLSEIADTMEFDTEQDKFFYFNELLTEQLQKEYPNLNEGEVDHYAEQIYDKIFS